MTIASPFSANHSNRNANHISSCSAPRGSLPHCAMELPDMDVSIGLNPHHLQVNGCASKPSALSQSHAEFSENEISDIVSESSQSEFSDPELAELLGGSIKIAHAKKGGEKVHCGQGFAESSAGLQPRAPKEENNVRAFSVISVNVLSTREN